jgi:hypothetical protein
MTALIGYHGLRTQDIRHLQLTDVDGPRLRIGGRTVLLAGLARRRLSTWLDHRAARWPATRNPHLFINTYTAVRAGTVSHHYVLQTVAMAIQQIREDRILHEALATGGDVRRLATCSAFPWQPRSVTPPSSTPRTRPAAPPGMGCLRSSTTMTADDTPLPITLSATEMTQLGALVTELGRFPVAAASSASTWPPPSATMATLPRDTSPACSRGCGLAHPGRRAAPSPRLDPGLRCWPCDTAGGAAPGTCRARGSVRQVADGDAVRQPFRITPAAAAAPLVLYRLSARCMS